MVAVKTTTIRISEEEKKILRAAAGELHLPYQAFIRSAAMQAAERILERAAIRITSGRKVEIVTDETNDQGGR